MARGLAFLISLLSPFVSSSQVRFYPKGPVSLASFSPLPLPFRVQSSASVYSPPPGISFLLFSSFYHDTRYLRVYNRGSCQSLPNSKSARTPSEQESCSLASARTNSFHCFETTSPSFVIQRVGPCHIIEPGRAGHSFHRGVPQSGVAKINIWGWPASFPPSTGSCIPLPVTTTSSGTLLHVLSGDNVHIFSIASIFSQIRLGASRSLRYTYSTRPLVNPGPTRTLPPEIVHSTRQSSALAAGASITRSTRQTFLLRASSTHNRLPRAGPSTPLHIHTGANRH